MSSPNSKKRKTTSSTEEEPRVERDTKPRQEESKAGARPELGQHVIDEMRNAFLESTTMAAALDRFAPLYARFTTSDDVDRRGLLEALVELTGRHATGYLLANELACASAACTVADTPWGAVVDHFRSAIQPGVAAIQSSVKAFTDELAPFEMAKMQVIVDAAVPADPDFKVCKRFQALIAEHKLEHVALHPVLSADVFSAAKDKSRPWLALFEGCSEPWSSEAGAIYDLFLQALVDVHGQKESIQILRSLVYIERVYNHTSSFVPDIDLQIQRTKRLCLAILQIAMQPLVALRIEYVASHFSTPESCTPLLALVLHPDTLWQLDVVSQGLSAEKLIVYFTGGVPTPCPIFAALRASIKDLEDDDTVALDDACAVITAGYEAFPAIPSMSTLSTLADDDASNLHTTLLGVYYKDAEFWIDNEHSITWQSALVHLRSVLLVDECVLAGSLELPESTALAAIQRIWPADEKCAVWSAFEKLIAESNNHKAFDFCRVGGVLSSTRLCADFDKQLEDKELKADCKTIPWAVLYNNFYRMHQSSSVIPQVLLRALVQVHGSEAVVRGLRSLVLINECFNRSRFFVKMACEAILHAALQPLAVLKTRFPSFPACTDHDPSIFMAALCADTSKLANTWMVADDLDDMAGHFLRNTGIHAPKSPEYSPTPPGFSPTTPCLTPTSPPVSLTALHSDETVTLEPFVLA